MTAGVDARDSTIFENLGVSGSGEVVRVGVNESLGTGEESLPVACKVDVLALASCNKSFSLLEAEAFRFPKPASAARRDSLPLMFVGLINVGRARSRSVAASSATGFPVIGLLLELRSMRGFRICDVLL